MDRISNKKHNLHPKHIKFSQQFFSKVLLAWALWCEASVFPNSWFLSRRMFSLCQSTSSTAARRLDFRSNHFLTTPATVCCCSDISLLRYPPMWCELLILTTVLTMKIFPTQHSFSYRILLAPPPPATAPPEPHGPAAAGLWAGPGPALLWPWRYSALCRCPCTYLLHIFCPENTMVGSWDKGCWCYSWRVPAKGGSWSAILGGG